MYDNNHITVDDFGYNVYDRENRKVTEHKSSKIRLMICDEAFFKIEDKLTMKASGYNDGALVMQNFYHIWQAINIRPWANCVVFVEEDEEKITDVQPRNDIVAVGGTAEFTITPDTYVASEEDIVCVNVVGDNGADDITTENWTEFFDVTVQDNVITIGAKDNITTTDSAYILVFEIGGVAVTGIFQIRS